MPPRKRAVAVKATPTPDPVTPRLLGWAGRGWIGRLDRPPTPGTRITGIAPCTGCGSVACAATGLTFCRHTGAPRIPDPVAAARLAATGLPGPLIPTTTVEVA